MALTWEQHQQNIFGGESGGDYDALFGYHNRPDGAFSGVKVSQMPVGDVIKFTDPSGTYGRWVKSQLGYTATPVGAYQVVGTTLRDAVKALGIDPEQKFDKATQDKIGQYILKTQGTGAWEGYGKGGASMQNKPAQAAQPQQPQQPQGLLGGILGGQGIGGALGLSEDFRDRLRMGILAGSDPRAFAVQIQGAQQAIANRAEERRKQKARNATADYLERIGQTDAANLLRQGAISGSDALSFGKGAKGTDDMREYELAKADGFEGSFTDFLRVKSEFGTTPQGYRRIRAKDAEGNETFSYVKVEGGPAAQEDIEAQKAAAAKDKTALQDELTFNATGSRILYDITNNPSYIPATGLVGTAFSKTLFGQTQKDIQEDLEVLEAQMQFGALADLKASSANGASGLGQLTEAERKALGKTRFNFSSLQGPEAVKRNIRAAMMVRSYFKNGIVDTKTGELRNATAEEFKMMMNGENPFAESGDTQFVGDIQNYIGGFGGTSAAEPVVIDGYSIVKVE